MWRSGANSAHLPAVAHRRAKRTEWRMRGIEPNNKIIVVFPSSVLPSRRFGNPPFPEGEGLIGCVHDCHLGALVEKSPATGTAQYVHAPAHLPAQAPRLTAETETIVLVMRRNEGVPPYRRIRPQTKRPHLTKKTLFNQACPRTALSLRGAQRATRQSPGREDGRNGAAQTQPTCPRRLTAEKSPAIETRTIVHEYPEYLPARSPCLARGGLRCPTPHQPLRDNLPQGEA